MNFDLSPERAAALLALPSSPRPLALLAILPDNVNSPFAVRCLRACDYVYFLQSGWITDNGMVTITTEGEKVVNAIRASRQRFTFGRFEAGDLVTITSIKPIIGRGGHVAKWEAQTDSEYHVNLYPEDFRALSAAGHDVPVFNSRAMKTVLWDVYVSREPDAVTGWRVADINLPPQS